MVLSLDFWKQTIDKVMSCNERDRDAIAKMCYDVESRGGETSIYHQTSVYYGMNHCHCYKCVKNNGGRRIR